MSIVLSKEALDNIKKYRYQTNGLTVPEYYIFEPFWAFITNFLPEVSAFTPF